MAFQDAVVENKVGLEIVLIDEDSLLASLEAETAAHLQQECLQVIQDVRLQLGFRIDFLRLYPQKFERHRIVQNIARSQLLGVLHGKFLQRFLVLRKPHALVVL